MSILVIKARSSRGREQCVLDTSAPATFSVGGGGDWQPCGAGEAPLVQLKSDGVSWRLHRLRGAVRVDGVPLTGVLTLRAPAVVSLGEVSLLIDDALEPGIQTIALDTMLRRRGERERTTLLPPAPPSPPSATVRASDFERLRAAPSSPARQAQSATARSLAVRPATRRTLGLERALELAREETERSPVWQALLEPRSVTTTVPNLPRPGNLPPPREPMPRPAEASELAALTQVVDGDSLRAEFAKRFEETLRNQRAAKLAAAAAPLERPASPSVTEAAPAASPKLSRKPRPINQRRFFRALLMLGAAAALLCAVGAYKVVRGASPSGAPSPPPVPLLARAAPSAAEPRVVAAAPGRVALASATPKRAADAFIRGEFEQALALYRALAAASPENESYALFVSSLTRRLSTAGTSP